MKTPFPKSYLQPGSGAVHTLFDGGQMIAFQVFSNRLTIMIFLPLSDFFSRFQSKTIDSTLICLTIMVFAY